MARELAHDLDLDLDPDPDPDPDRDPDRDRDLDAERVPHPPLTPYRRCALNHSKVRESPSSIATSGLQPMTCAAAEGSMQERLSSPSRAGA